MDGTPSTEFPATPTQGGRYMQYDINGVLFEVPAKYQPIKTIGQGAYGIVCSATNIETNERVAIKKVIDAFNNLTDAKRTLREIKLLRQLNHQNVIMIKDVIPPPDPQAFKDMYIVTELMDFDLSKVIRSHQKMSDEHCQYLLYQLLNGLKYIHSANVIHRDLKPSNLLVNKDCDLRICDFGLARKASENDLLTEYVVTRWYRAPELLLGSTDYTAAIDVWSVGCIFMELMIRRPLFPGKNPMHQMQLITELIGTPTEEELGFIHNDGPKRYMRHLPRRPHQSFVHLFPQLSPAATDLVERMLAFDPTRRITVEEALAHPYLERLHDTAYEPICTEPFSCDFEEEKLTEEQLKELTYKEALDFNPDYDHDR